MISPRRKRINPFILALATWPRLVAGQPFSPKEIQMLIATYVLQMEKNFFPTIYEIMERTCYAKRDSANFIMNGLIKNGMVELVQGIGYNVTVKGEYYVRGLATSISRMAGDSPRSRWTRPGIVESEYKRQYMRKSTKIK